MDEQIRKHWIRLEEAKEFYCALLEVFNEKQLNFEPESGSWSMLEVMQHLYVSEQISFHFMKNFDFSRKDEKLGAMAQIKTILLVNRLNSKKKFKVPELLSEKKHAVGASHDIVGFAQQWEMTRSEMFSFLNLFPTEKRNNFVFVHPKVGKLNVCQTLQFFVAHMKHHQYQIEAINHHKNFPN